MVSEDIIKKLTIRWQTNSLNVVREYLQNLFLSYLYQQPLSEKLGLKGGTALRIIYKSPRFSEDLDFSGALKVFQIEEILSKTIAQLWLENIGLKVVESKPTSGGYLALYSSEIFKEKVGLELNISLRSEASFEPVLVNSELVPPYQCIMLLQEELVTEKMEALLSRQKPRDFFDLYFLIRERLSVNQIIKHKSEILKLLERLPIGKLSKELKVFLPASHKQVINDLQDILKRELKRL